MKAKPQQNVHRRFRLCRHEAEQRRRRFGKQSAAVHTSLNATIRGLETVRKIETKIIVRSPQPSLYKRSRSEMRFRDQQKSRESASRQLRRPFRSEPLDLETSKNSRPAVVYMVNRGVVRSLVSNRKYLQRWRNHLHAVSRNAVAQRKIRRRDLHSRRSRGSVHAVRSNSG